MESALRGRPRLGAGFALRTRLAVAALPGKCPLFIVLNLQAASKPALPEEFRSRATKSACSYRNLPPVSRRHGQSEAWLPYAVFVSGAVRERDR